MEGLYPYVIKFTIKVQGNCEFLDCDHLKQDIPLETVRRFVFGGVLMFAKRSGAEFYREALEARFSMWRNGTKVEEF